VGFASTLEDTLHLARGFYAGQEYATALRYYRVYLDGTPNHVGYADVVIEASQAIVGVAGQVDFLQSYLGRLTTLKGKQLVYKHLAFLHEYLGDYSTAISYFTLAYEHSRPLEHSYYLRVAKLSFELGEYERSLYMARRVASMGQQPVDLQDEVLIVMIRSVLMMPDELENLQKVVQEHRLFIEEHSSASLLYLLYLGYHRHQQLVRSEEFRVKLMRRYPESPEALELQGRVKRSIAPSLLWW
jgi:tetratricopeptide (TPR) repeat protein